jgi:membrane-associated phospholipid phosphatase
MEKLFAQTLSVVFQPIFVPLYSVLILFNTDTYISYAVAPMAQTFIYAIITMNMILLPSLLFFFFKQRGIITSYHMVNAEERLMPFMVTLVFHASTYYLLLELNVPDLLPNMVLGGAISIVLVLLINLKWKISIHMLGMGGMVGLLIGLVFRHQVPIVPVIVACVLLSGLVGFARLRLNAHSPKQVYAGFVLGLTVMVATVILG